MSRFNQGWRDVNGPHEDLANFTSMVFHGALGFLIWVSFLCFVLSIGQ